jgi:hypothetical protein
MLPSVSVVVSAFDAERFVGEAIESALAQDYPASSSRSSSSTTGRPTRPRRSPTTMRRQPAASA